MTRPSAPGAPLASQQDPGGPILALCLGRRCSALRALAGTEHTVQQLRDAVGSTRGAVLVTAGCLGPCALAAVAAVAHRSPGTDCSGTTVWLTGVQEPRRADALAGWIGAGGPSSDGTPQADVPVGLLDAVAGVGAPMRMVSAAG